MGCRNARVGIALAALLVAGCAETAVPAESPLPAGIALEIIQQRSDVADRAVQIRVVNGSAVDLVVTRVELLDARFAAPQPRDRISPVPAGRAVDLRVGLPDAVCGDEHDAAGGPQVRLELADIGTVTAPAADVLDVLGPIHARECFAARVSAIAVVEVVGFTPSAPGEPATMTVGVQPVGGDGTLELVELRETNLLRMPGSAGTAHALGVVVRGDGAPFELAVPLLPTRCDPHAVQEDKRGTVFGLGVRLDGVDGVIELASPPALRADILDWVAAWCEFGS